MIKTHITIRQWLRPSLWIILFGSLTWLSLLQAQGSDGSGFGAAAGQPAPGLQAFHLLDEQTGWALTTQGLWWTETGGATWRDVTPAGFVAGAASHAFFLDSRHGRMVQSVRQGHFEMSFTADGGRSWQQRSLALMDADDPDAQAEALYMHWIDPATGWLAVKRSTSSNFNQGTLWQTEDGGVTWQRRALPGGEPVFFLSPQRGWTAGGPNGDHWYRSDDGGRTWVSQPLPYPATVTAGGRRHFLPRFAADGRTGLLPVMVTAGAHQHAEWYHSSNGGLTWELMETAGASVTPGVAAAIANNVPDVYLTERSGQTVLATGAPLPFFGDVQVTDGIWLATVQMVTPHTGWALAVPGPYLLGTSDGGRQWQPLSLPGTELDVAAAASSTTNTRMLARTAIFRGAGFDMCDIAPADQLQQWHNHSPYRVVNLYIGGALRFCANQRLTASLVTALSSQGWQFIPTWVGPQAPCYGNPDAPERISRDLGTAHTQGMEEAVKAVSAAQQLGLTTGDGSGTIIYYDLEGFDAKDSGCVEAARAFVAGWSTYLHASGNQAGLYGSACSPEMQLFANARAVPDAVWIAAWNRNAYDPNATVWQVPAGCLPPTLWSSSQRIRQYTGGHDELWGGITFNIDSNVLDGLVASPQPVSSPVAVVVEEPLLSPEYSEELCVAGWHRYASARGMPAYLTASQRRGATIPPLNYGIWRPTLPMTGTYQVEVFIPSHGALEWPCFEKTLGPDTQSAHYVVHHEDGVTTVVRNQLPVDNGWLDLGIYPFGAGQDGYVYLEGATSDNETRLVSFSAARFTLRFEGTLDWRVYLPIVQ
ncbi:MAG: DUF1906 domain-containing protein [Caldilineaceae bacterium]|nr:DUF1906 domain-containing protein [Caldilineaceae bacterium]